LRVAADLAARGCRLAFPFGENCDYDLIADTGDRLHRVQVKYTESDGEIVQVRCGSHSLTNGRVWRRKLYTAETVDWIAVYDRATDACFYVPAAELGSGRAIMHLRLAPARNNQRTRINFAEDFRGFPEPVKLRLDS
jgi:hypothetical protein